MAFVGYVGALAVGAGLWLVIAGMSRRSAGVAALRSLSGASDTFDLREAHLRQGLWARLGAPLLEVFGRAGHRITPGARTDALRRRLDSAGSSMRVETFLAGKAAAVGVGLLVGLAWTLTDAPGGAVVLLAGVIAGYAGPELVVKQRGAARQEDISRTLPEALDLLALTVQAGLGFEQGVAEVAGETGGPLGFELDRMLKEQQLGRSRRESLEALIRRNSSEELRTLVGALLHADRLGTPLAEALKVQAREARRRRRASARERAGKAPVKLLFPLLFGVFPAMFVVIIGPGALRIMEALLR